MSARGSRAVRIAGVAALAALIGHALSLRFLCDDAFIAFRYARNLARGNGLVFNPGFERVEGFTSPLWVALLAALDALGLAPESVANALSLGLTVVLWALLARASRRVLPEGAPAWIAVLPVAWLAVTRSVAVWSTGGLETRLFEVLVLAGVLRLAAELDAPNDPRSGPTPWAAVWLGLACWARPDGFLVAAATLTAAAAWSVRRRRFDARRAASSTAVFLAIVGAQFALRLAYFGAWLPNTYYAKVDGQTWWGMGVRYLTGFAMEYAVVLWLPLIVAGIWSFVRGGASLLPLLAGVAVVPHLLYVASIGGDHFEYRPLDLYFPFAYLVMARGAAWAASRRGRAPFVAGYAILVAIGLSALPHEARRQFPARYVAGFPGLAAHSELGAWTYLDPSTAAWMRVPGIRGWVECYRVTTRALTRRFVAVRREEHALFRGTVEAEAVRLRQLVESGQLPIDLHVALGSVGVLPYVSGLRTLDRFGLTDAEVARLPASEVRVMAHEKLATIELARRRGVDLWAVDPVHLLFREDDPALLERISEARGRGDDAFFADAGEGWWMLARSPAGLEAARARLPRWELRDTADVGEVERLAEASVAAMRRRGEPDLGLARVLDLASRSGEADEVRRALAARGDPDALLALAREDVAAGRTEDGLARLDRVLTSCPGAAPAWYLRGVALARAGRAGEAVESLLRAVREDPDDDDARFALALAQVLAGNPAAAERQIERLARRRPDLAAKARGAVAAPVTP